MSTTLSTNNLSSVGFSRPQPKSYDLPEDAMLIKKGEKLNVEPGHMMAFKDLTFTASINNQSTWEKIKNFFLGTKSLFTSQFEAKDQDGWILFEEEPHNIYKYEISRGTPGLNINQSGLLAYTSNVDLTSSYTGLSGFFKGMGIGQSYANLSVDAQFEDQTGAVYIKSGLGKIRAVSVDPNSPTFVDNNNIIAYTDGLSATLQVGGGGFKTALFSGEFLLTKFEGKGTVFVGTDLSKLFVDV